MKITFLCSDENHPVNAYLEDWKRQHDTAHEVSILRRAADLSEGDMLFLVSCSEVIRTAEREQFANCLVLHASDLPAGRGWSPYIWEILGGAREITVSLLEVEDEVDSGNIWKKLKVSIPDNALLDEIHTLLFSCEIELIDFAVNNWETVVPEKQSESVEPSYYPKRTPKDNELLPQLSIEEQFDRIRVSDSDRYPAFVTLRGKRFKLILESFDEDSDAD